MKKTNKLLASALAASLFCLTAAACSGEGGNDETTTESNIPITMDLSETVQTTPEIVLTDSTITGDGIVETTEQTSEENDVALEESVTENSETSIIEEITTASTEEATEPSVSDNGIPDISIGANGEGAGIVELALSMEGKPFYYGGADPDTGFDNSGFMYYVLSQNGIDCPRLTNKIAEWGEKVTYDELKPGYLVFFEYEGSGKADFGGIYVGDGYMIASTNEDRPVSKTNIATDYYQKTFQFGIKTF